MTVLDQVVPDARPHVVGDEPISATPKADRRVGVWQALSAPRAVPVGLRYSSTIGAAMLAFAPAVVANYDAVINGSPTAYLLFIPVWCLLIAFGLDTTRRGREIGDCEFDRILVVVVGGALGLTAALVIPRIPAVAGFWHADLLPMLIWVFAASIVFFGIRRVIRDYLVWLFLLGCFPPNFLLLGQALGGSTAAFASLSVVLALVVTYLALRRRPRLALATVAVAALAGFALVPVSADRPAVAFTVPAAVVTATAIIVRLRVRRADGGTTAATLPKQSVLTLASAWIVAALILVLTPHTPNSPVPVATPPVAEDWLREFRTLGIGITEPRVFDWGPRAMGSHGDVRRYRITAGMTGPESRPLSTAYLDVYSTTDPGRFASYRRGLWYETVPPATITATPASGTDRHIEIGSIANTPESVRTSADALWTGRFWGWRAPTPAGDRYFAFYLMAARDQTGPADVVEPRLPSYASTVVEPAGWLIRGGTDAESHDENSLLDAALTELAWSMVDVAERPGR
ncbi:hypothetical protein [Gordonia terrae]|uniref:hypothetical protein n=1 Tax=Gordonia terrae TaxID=2055 RepID=UPI0003A5C2AB|nr:hypothetical protein [Gordonia terrae]